MALPGTLTVFFNWTYCTYVFHKLHFCIICNLSTVSLPLPEMGSLVDFRTYPLYLLCTLIVYAADGPCLLTDFQGRVVWRREETYLACFLHNFLSLSFPPPSSPPQHNLQMFVFLSSFPPMMRFMLLTCQ